jgi:hypothetical protein
MDNGKASIAGILHTWGPNYVLMGQILFRTHEHAREDTEKFFLGVNPDSAGSYARGLI